MSDENHIARLVISKIIDNNNGTSTLHFDLDDEFIEWFKKREGLKRFSHKRFQKFISDSLSSKGDVKGNIIQEKD
tara:strand:+ start:133 stop:357 length:225 start_codon:yes stop_codon:yes gene_type:complete